MARAPIHAAGGIVFRGRKRLLIAVVQRSKDERWVLPRGKLKRKEDPQVGARREVVEETGHPVEVHEFVGAITYRTSGRPKVVQFWHMHAAARPNRDVMADIARVAWLPLKAAVRRLSFPLERLFLAEVGGRLLRERRKRAGARKRQARRKKTKKTAAAHPRRASVRGKRRASGRPRRAAPRRATR